MKVTFTMDKTDGEVLAVYFALTEHKVHRTIEISEGECYVDLDRNNKPIGVEMLRPGQMEIFVKKVARKYHIQGMNRAFNKLKEQLAI